MNPQWCSNAVWQLVWYYVRYMHIYMGLWLDLSVGKTIFQEITCLFFLLKL